MKLNAFFSGFCFWSGFLLWWINLLDVLVSLWDSDVCVWRWTHINDHQNEINPEFVFFSEFLMIISDH